MIYLDNAATTLIKPQSVSREMLRALQYAASPGRGGHEPAMRAAQIVYSCREAAAELFNVPECERIVFTMNATHALNIAINSLVQKGSRVLVSGYEHNSVTRALEAVGARIMVAQSPLFDTGAAIDSFRDKIHQADVVVCTHVSNVFGFILPIYEIAKLCREHSVPLIVDASQSAGVLDVDYSRLNAAFIAAPGHKALFGPQGTGLLICGEEGRPLISGGSGSDSISQTMPDFLPDRLEAGTHNVPGIAGLGAGIRFVRDKGIDNINRHEQELLSCVIDTLTDNPQIELFNGEKGTQSGVLSLRCRGMDCEEVARRLALEAVCVRSGLHCSPYAHRSAGTLGTGTLRVSFSPFVTLENAHDFCRILQNLLAAEA